MSEPPERGDELQEGVGGQPLIDPHHRRECMRMLARFPMGIKCRVKAVEEMEAILEDEEATARDKAGAARVLASFDGLNMEQEKRALGLADETINITQQVAIVGGDADRLCDRMLGEVEYERLQRDRAVQADGDPGAVGEIGERRAVDPGPPPGGNGRGPNGRGPAPGERGD